MLSNAGLIFVLVNIIAISYCSPLKFKNLEMHPNCLNSTFCFERGNYPEELIEYLVNKTDLMKYDGAVLEYRQTSHSIVSPCDYRKSYDPIYQVRDIQNKVRYVVQATRFRQVIKLEWCLNKGELHENKGQFLNLEQLNNDYYSASCVETYTNYRFLVLAEDGKGFESVRVNAIPICCRCEIKPIVRRLEDYFK